MELEERVVSAPQKGGSESELHRARGLNDMKNFRGDSGEPPVKDYTFDTLLKSGQIGERIGNGRKWTYANWIDGVLSNSLVFPNNVVPKDVKRRTIEAVEYFQDPETMRYLRERKEHYAALKHASNGNSMRFIKTHDEIQTGALKSDLYLNPERIAEITGLSHLEIESLVNVPGMRTIPLGYRQGYAFNSVNLIQYFMKKRDTQEAAVRLYNWYITLVLKKPNHRN